MVMACNILRRMLGIPTSSKMLRDWSPPEQDRSGCCIILMKYDGRYIVFYCVILSHVIIC